MQTQTESGLLVAYSSFKEGDLQKAKLILEAELKNDLDNGEIIFSLKCARYWINVFEKKETITNNFQKGEFLLNEWSNFLSFIGKDDNKYKQAVYATKRGIFTVALENYQKMINERDKTLKAEVLCRIGLCHKALGNYEAAIRFLQDANTMQSNSASILAELGDCYALCGEEKTAKVLFRESFFINAQEVQGDFLESELYNTLRESTIKKGFKDKELLEWIPVFGVLYGVLNVKRELRALESGKLRQTVLALEKDINESNGRDELLIPRLIYKYFWLIDYHVTTTGERVKINEILMKIKLLDSEIYEQYTK